MRDDAPDDREVEMGETTGRAPSAPQYAEERMGPPLYMGFIASTALALLIGWVPIVGALVAGLAGGWLARTSVRGTYATLIPASVCATWFWLVTYLPELPFANWLADTLAPMDVLITGASAFWFSIVFGLQFILCIAGGWAGGALQERRGHHEMELE